MTTTNPDGPCPCLVAWAKRQRDWSVDLPRDIAVCNGCGRVYGLLPPTNDAETRLAHRQALAAMLPTGDTAIITNLTAILTILDREARADGDLMHAARTEGWVR